MEQLKKNSVSALGQTIKKVYYVNEKESDVKILFVGNSITYHEPNSDIGWSGSWGMAASSPENDYVHCVAEILKTNNIRTGICIAQAAEYERNYENEDAESFLPWYEDAANFKPDIIVMRIAENMPYENVDESKFKEGYLKLLSFFKRDTNAKVIFTGSFWKHPADKYIKMLAGEYGYPFIELGNLGELDEMKATGLFEHSGVAAHPGDLGMQMIAERIAGQLLKLLK